MCCQNSAFDILLLELGQLSSTLRNTSESQKPYLCTLGCGEIICEALAYTNVRNGSQSTEVTSIYSIVIPKSPLQLIVQCRLQSHV